MAGWNLTKGKSCKLMADLIATAPKLEKVYIQAKSHVKRGIQVRIRYAKENGAPGYVRLIKVKKEYQRNAAGRIDRNIEPVWTEKGEICRKTTTKLKNV